MSYYTTNTTDSIETTIATAINSIKIPNDTITTASFNYDEYWKTLESLNGYFIIEDPEAIKEIIELVP